MNIHHTLICFFLMLQDVKTGLINAETRIYTGTEGGNIKVSCSFFLHGNTKILCKDKCEKKEDILLETTEDRAERGRYRIEYKRGAFTERATLYVSITQLNMSDSGRYWCGLERFGPDGHDEFEIRVIEASTTSKPNLTLRPLSTSLPPSSTSSTLTTTTQSSGSSVGSPTHSSASETNNQPETSPADSAVQLYVGLVLVFMITVLSVAVLIFCRNRASKPRGPPLETAYAKVTKDDRVYEEVREENGQSRAPPVEVFTVYACTKYTKPNAVETTDDYSLAEDSEVTYSNLHFPNAAATLLHRAPSGNADNGVYSVPRVEVNSASHANDASTLYSTVTLH
ncbi:CMRF35-like molecule 5 isoform X2 [Seriola dumerili]|uniref:CMRF35-like molecule 5 isoform X2 n=1 Tax=Seriola dumerili TaxID=41447 RepID=UPI000BBEE9F8|nr:CMRF35-like molecule 5 isoform X2 [Seriola dumerili]